MVKRCLKFKILYFSRVFQFHKIWHLLTRQIVLHFGLKIKTYATKQVPIPIINLKENKKKVILKYVLEIVIKTLNEISLKSFQQYQQRLIMVGKDKLHKIIHLKNNLSHNKVKYHRLNHLSNHSN
jgi:hypothetical protein